MNTPIADFRSDNSGRVAPELIAALAAANTGTALGYGGDPFTAKLQERFTELFETPVRVFPVPTGTAANALSLAAVCPSFGAIYCSTDAHINTSEGNGVGFFGGGTRMVAIPGPHGKIEAQLLERAIAAAGVGLANKAQPAAVNLVQSTDLGAVYSMDEVAAISQVAHAHGLKVHMDGARIANAIARLGCTPAQATWKSGVDILSFGITKNGGLLADAIVVFTPDVATDIGFHLRRGRNGLVQDALCLGPDPGLCGGRTLASPRRPSQRCGCAHRGADSSAGRCRPQRTGRGEHAVRRDGAGRADGIAGRGNLVPASRARLGPFRLPLGHQRCRDRRTGRSDHPSFSYVSCGRTSVAPEPRVARRAPSLIQIR